MKDNGFECICTRVCDCQLSEPKNGSITLFSNGCPVHNLYPEFDDDCQASVHWFELGYIEGTEKDQLLLF